MVKEHGADALRLYLINSPVVRAEPLKFKKEGVKGVVRDVFLPWFHAFRFFNQSVQRYEVGGSSWVGLGMYPMWSVSWHVKWGFYSTERLDRTSNLVSVYISFFVFALVVFRLRPGIGSCTPLVRPRRLTT